MPTLRTLGGKLIVRGGDLGTDDKCCCGCCCVDGEPDPTKTDESACSDAGGIWFASEADCANVDCTGCACVFPIDDALEVTFVVSVNVGCGGDVGIVNGNVTITLAPNNGEGLYQGTAEFEGLTITAYFGCGGPVADGFGLPASKYWSTVTISGCTEEIIEPFDANDFGLHDVEASTLSGGSRICKPKDGNGALSEFISWAVTIEEPFIT